jgi:hypothetical protein
MLILKGHCFLLVDHWAIIGLIAGLLAAPMPVYAVEMLLNRSFETPVGTANGNNFFATLPNWTIVPSPVVTNPVNLIKTFVGYGGLPSAPPAGGGIQYLDIRNAGGTVTQSVTFPTSGVVSISGWFSLRDAPRNLVGSIALINSSNVTVASPTATFVSTEPLGLWKQASANNIAVQAGTYQFRVTMDNFHNTDLMSVDFVADAPALVIDKNANRVGPLVVGDLVTYTYTVRNSGNVPLANVNVNDLHQGTGTLPTVGGEVLQSDVAPTGDTTDPAIANPALADGVWATLGVGDTIRFSSTYLVTQQDIDTFQ